MIRGVRAAKSAPSWQDLRAVRSRKAVCGAFRMHGAQILPKPAHFGCMARESCRELAIFPSEAAFGMHGAQNLPRIDARERTARVYCHCQSGQERIRAQSCHLRAPGNAFREHFVIGERPGTHRASILPLPVARERIREDLAMDERLDSPRTKQLPLSPQKKRRRRQDLENAHYSLR